jgi:hypothetical protein
MSERTDIWSIRGRRTVAMVTPSAPAETVLSVTEVIDGIRGLSDADALRFRRASHYLSHGDARSPTELRNEAVRRAADGSRKCPRNLPIVVFLFGVMRSIASTDRKAADRTPKLAVVPRDSSAGATLLEGVDPRLSPEDRLIKDEEITELKVRVLDLFRDDLVIHTLVEGLITGMEGEELRKLVGLSLKDFATKRRFVRRRIDKAFPNGWKP